MSLINVAGQANITSPVSQQRLALAFSKNFLIRLEKENPTPFVKFAREYPIMQRQGYKIIVTLTNALDIASNPLTDGVQAAKNASFTTSNIAMTLDFYGNDIGWSTLFDLTAVDIAKETHSEELVMNAKESITQLMLDRMDALSLDSTNLAMTFSRAVAAARKLKGNRVRGFTELNGLFCGVIGPYAWEDMTTEGGAAYKDHYQYGTGSEVLADGQLAKPAAGIQFFQSNYNKWVSGVESQYFWGKDALAKTEIEAGLAGVNGRAINLEGIASLAGYLVPQQAQLSDIYGLQAHAVWRGGPLAVAVADSNRIVTLGVSTS
jgi:N4-gp56 family major capsid protein